LRVRDVMSESPAMVERKETVGDVIAMMRRRKVREVPVVDRRIPVGLVSYTTLVSRRSIPLSAKVETIMLPSPRLDEATRLTDAAEALMAAGIRGAPVVRNDRVVGFLSRTDIVGAFAKDRRSGKQLVKNIMTENPIAVGPDDTVREAISMMDNLNEKALPVVDEGGDIIGVVGMTEIIDSVWRPKALRPPRTPKPPRKVFGDREPTRIKVGSIMTRTPITIGPDDTVAKAASLMLKHGIATVFVRDEDKLVGVVSHADLMEMVVGLRSAERVYVQISGLENRDPSTYELLDMMVSKAAQRIARVDQPRVLSVHATSYNKDGAREKYSLKGRLTTKSGFYYAQSSEWDLLAAMDSLLDKLSRKVMSNRERRIQNRKRRAADVS
jgi:CBS domain-containing protein/ribosome-associated translation inhibitor RaiA